MDMSQQSPGSKLHTIMYETSASGLQGNLQDIYSPVCSRYILPVHMYISSPPHYRAYMFFIEEVPIFE